MLRFTLALALMLASAIAAADVFDQYGRKHGINPNVLRSIASIESNLNPNAINFDGEPFTIIKSRQDAIRLIGLIRQNPYMVRVDIPKVKHPRRYFYNNLDSAKSRREAVMREISAKALPAASKITVRRLDPDNFDVGLMQVNNRWHGKSFDSLDEMFDINKNLDYAAGLLKSLSRQHGGITEAIAHYHSPTDWRQRIYLEKFGRSYRSWERTIASISAKSNKARN